jgi:hypothetical protein
MIYTDRKVLLLCLELGPAHRCPHYLATCCNISANFTPVSFLAIDTPFPLTKSPSQEMLVYSRLPRSALNDACLCQDVIEKTCDCATLYQKVTTLELHGLRQDKRSLESEANPVEGKGKPSWRK